MCECVFLSGSAACVSDVELLPATMPDSWRHSCNYLLRPVHELLLLDPTTPWALFIAYKYLL
jgi:hypothetical protein